MPKQTHRGGRYIPPPKGKKAPKKAGAATTAARQPLTAQEPVVARPVSTMPTPITRPPRSTTHSPGADAASYAYVIADLKAIGLTAGAMFLILAVLAIFIR